MTAVQHTLHSRLRLTVPPQAVFDALTDPGPLHRWFRRHASALGAVEPPEQYGLRGGYHFWSSFCPDPPPVVLTTLMDMRLPREDDPRFWLRYVWDHRGSRSDVELTLAPLADGALLHLAHHGLAPLAADPLGGAAYWTVVLENLRLFLLGGDGLAFHHARRQGQLEVGLTLITPGLDATAAAWELLTTPRALDALWASGAQIEPHVGGALSYGWDRGGPGEIVTFQPPALDHGVGNAQLAATWQLAGDPLPTVVTWSLSGRGAVTRLTLVHSGFGDADAAAPYEDTWRAMLGRMQEKPDGKPEWE